jgi:hypothetical protein
MASQDEVEAEEMAEPDTAERTLRPGSRPKQPRTEAPAETEASEEFRPRAAATVVTVATPGTAATAEPAATVSRPAINRLEPKAATPVREETVDPVERSEHSPVRMPATVVTVATPESPVTVAWPPVVEPVEPVETVPMAAPAAPAARATVPARRAATVEPAAMRATVPTEPTRAR